ncbi:hypothetical protein V501_02545 [Pseudogymnoascus sp. VKM F-4519 (FW-2642)]|nr:hypothetical protein V501_02545 [Pseudogymnoascus sp. VKM F-4519 (FW-2642)]
MHKRLLRQHIQRRRLGDPAVRAPDPEDLRFALARAGDQVLGDGEDGVAAPRGAVDVGEHLGLGLLGMRCRYSKEKRKKSDEEEETEKSRYDRHRPYLIVLVFACVWTNPGAENAAND